jgi:hypothetical protein
LTAYITSLPALRAQCAKHPLGPVFTEDPDGAAFGHPRSDASAGDAVHLVAILGKRDVPPLSIAFALIENGLARTGAGVLPQPIQDEVATLRCLHGAMLATSQSAAQLPNASPDEKPPGANRSNN